jgi:hypothetical protein
MAHRPSSRSTLTIFLFWIPDELKYAPRLPRDFGATSQDKVGIGWL